MLTQYYHLIVISVKKSSYLTKEEKVINPVEVAIEVVPAEKRVLPHSEVVGRKKRSNRVSGSNEVDNSAVIKSVPSSFFRSFPKNYFVSMAAAGHDFDPVKPRLLHDLLESSKVK